MELPKKYDFKEVEKKWNGYWEKEEIYKFNPKSKKKIYSIDTPPPYVSAFHLHVGHAMHYSQFEFIARYKRMKGHNVFFPMGFDDNGLPTERYVEKKYNIDKSKTTRKEFTNLCLKETKLGIQNYKKLWNDLGFSLDWGLTYSTIDPRSVKVAQTSFIDLYKKKFLKREDVPLLWDVKLQSTLAQAELEDQEKESFFNDIIFKVGGKDLMISTTRPELVPACVALFYNPKDKRYKNLKGKTAKVPLFDYEVPIMEDKNVALDVGSGLMMVCTFGDKEDVEKWMKYKLPLRVIIEKDGKLNELAGKYKGKEIKKAREEIIEDLKKEKLLINQKKIRHVVNVGERSGAEIEFLKSPQWIIDVLKHKKELLNKGNEINWHPEFMKTRYKHWVENLQWDWVISRQRFYGVPFPVWYKKENGEVVLPSLEELPVDPRDGAVPKGYKKGELIPEMDVMDTWMTSSLTPKINDAYDKTKLLPMSLRPQAHDIIRTWAFYTIVKSNFHDRQIPWKDIIISGHGLDEKGKKMSKSRNNFIEPSEVLEKYGADAFRFWAATSHLGKDTLYKEDNVSTGGRTVTKLWNASKFSLMHLEDFDNKKVKLDLIDQGIISKFNDLVEKAGESFEKYEYSRSKLLTEQFFWSQICDNYLEIAKDRLYNPDERGVESRKSAQYTLYYLLLNTLKLFAPIMPYITEEIYHLYFDNREKEKSIHLSEWPEFDKKLKNGVAEKTWDKFIEVLGKVRETKAKHSKSLKHEIVLTIPDEDMKVLRLVLDDLKAVTKAKELLVGKFNISL
jgi:valyl-tRNA synthetase